MLPGWIGLAAFARERGIDPQTMRRWALALDHLAGGGLLLWNKRRGKPRKYWVEPERLKDALKRDPQAQEATLSHIEDRLTTLEAKDVVLEKRIEVVKKHLKVVKAHANQLALDFARQSSSVTVAHP